MRKSKYNSFDELPLMLTVEDVSHVLGIGLAHAYEVAHRRDFPTITLGSRIIVPRDKFMEWIDEQLGGDIDMTRDEYNKMRGSSVREVASTHGSISFRDVLLFHREE